MPMVMNAARPLLPSNEIAAREHLAASQPLFRQRGSAPLSQSRSFRPARSGARQRPEADRPGRTDRPTDTAARTLGRMHERTHDDPRPLWRRGRPYRLGDSPCPLPGARLVASVQKRRRPVRCARCPAFGRWRPTVPLSER